MPVLIPYVAAIIGSTFWATVIVVAAEMAVMMIVSKLLQPSNSQGSQLSNGSTEEYSGTVTPRRIVYGTNLLGGLNAIPPWCSGDKNHNLAQVLVLAGHEVNAITDIWLNQEKVRSNDITRILQADTDGAIVTTSFANHIWVRRHTGAPGETMDFILQSAWPAFWDSAHIGVGLAKLYVQYAYDTTVYSGGKPEVRAMVQGKKCYDPRLDSVAGTNTQSAAYIRYTENPALCIIDYILDTQLGIGEAPTRIDWPSAVAAANLCDEMVSVPLLSALVAAWDARTTYQPADQVQTGGIVYNCLAANVNVKPPQGTYWVSIVAGTLTQKRYTCNTVLDCTQPYENNLKTLAAAYQGAVLYSSGKWVLLPGHWTPATFAIGDDDIAGAIDYQTAIPYASRYNAVRGQFYDPASLYQPNEYPPIRVISDEIADGEGPVWRELQQASCIDTFEAQRNAIIEQRKSRRKKTWAFPATYGMYGIRPGEVGTLTVTELGIFLQYVRCTGWKLDGKAMTVMLNLEEVDPADWYDPAVVIYQTAGHLETPAPANFISDPVSQFTALGGAGGITFHWQLPTIWHSNLSVELLESATANIAFASVIWSGVNTGAFIQKADTIVRHYWVQVRNIAGNTLSLPAPNDANGLAAASTTSGLGGPGPPGPPGPGGLSGSLSLTDVVFPATAVGHVTSYAGASGQFQVFVGTVDVTANCTFSIAPLGNISNLTYTLEGEGLGGASGTAESQSITGVGAATGRAAGSTVTAESQSVTAVGNQVSVTGRLRWDSTARRFDTTAVRWDKTIGTGGTPAGITGTGSTTE